MISIQVRCRVDQPRKVQHDAISQSAANEKGIPEIRSPSVMRHLRWHDIAHVQSKPRIEHVLQLDNRIGHEITKVHFAARLNDSRVLFDKEPTHVCKEKATRGIVWIRVCFRELVVHAVIAGPVVNGALVGNAVTEHEKDADGEGGFVRTMRPQTMNAHGDTKATVSE